MHENAVKRAQNGSLILFLLAFVQPPKVKPLQLQRQIARLRLLFFFGLLHGAHLPDSKLIASAGLSELRRWSLEGHLASLGSRKGKM